VKQAENESGGSFDDLTWKHAASDLCSGSDGCSAFMPMPIQLCTGLSCPCL